MIQNNLNQSRVNRCPLLLQQLVVILVMASCMITQFSVSVYATGEDPGDMVRAMWAKFPGGSFFFRSEVDEPDVIYKAYYGDPITIRFELFLMEWTGSDWTEWIWSLHGYSGCQLRGNATWSSTGGCEKTGGQDLWAEYTFPGAGHYTVTGRHHGFDCTGNDITGGNVTVDIYIWKAELKSIKFTSDQGVLRDNNSDWTDTGNVYGEPEWAVSPARNYPISHRWNETLSIQATVQLQPSGLNYYIIGDGPNSYVDFTSSVVASTGSDQVITVSASAGLPGTIGILEKTIGWDAILTPPDPDQSYGMADTGPHKIYLTAMTPFGSVCTEKRLNFVCSEASGQSSASGIVNEIYSALGSDPPYFDLFADAPDPIWLLMAGPSYKGQCVDLANLMKQALNLLGLSASIGYVYGSSDTDCYSTSPNAHETHVCGTHGTEKIYVYSAGGWNNWEAVCSAAGTLSAVKMTQGSAIEILRYWLSPAYNYQAWWWANDICTNPGPYPVPEP